MRDTIIRRAAICLGAVALAAAGLTGCGSSSSSSGSSSSPPSAATTSAAASSSTAAAQADPETTKAVTAAYTGFFDAKTPAAQKAALVEKGDLFAPVLQAQASNPQAQGTSATVSAVALTDPAHAAVTYSIVINGTPALPNQSGQAVQENGQWKVAASTFCALLKLQGGTSAAC